VTVGSSPTISICALELLDRQPVVAALVVHPAQAVDVEAVVGIDRERAPDQALGLVEVRTLLGERVAEVVQRGRVLRIELDRLAHLIERCPMIVGLVVERASVKR